MKQNNFLSFKLRRQLKRLTNENEINFILDYKSAKLPAQTGIIYVTGNRYRQYEHCFWCPC
jgi:hypothetical protein